MEPALQLEYFARIEQIEQDGSIDDLVWEGINLWTFYRMELLHKVLNGDEASEFSPLKEPVKQAFMAKRSHQLTLRRHGKTLLRSLKECGDFQTSDLLFFSEGDSHYLDRIEGKAYNRHMDPYFEAAIAAGYHGVKMHASIQLGSSEDFKHPPLVWFEGEENTLQDYLWTGRQLTKIIPTSTMVSTAEKLNVDLSRILTQAANLKLLLPFAEYVIKTGNFKALALTNYHNIFAQALILEARKAGVPTFDIQHGKQGSLNFSYSHFKHRITNSESLLPDGHWNWNEDSAKSINAIPGDEPIFRCAVGGNLWLAKNLQEEVVKPSTEEKAFLNQVDAAETSVLFCVQPQKDHLVPNWMQQYMKDHPEIIFGIRLHPRQIERDRQKLSDLDALPNVFIDEATSVFLFTALKHFDAVATRWSTVALEARYFGKKAVIVDTFGLRTFSKYIENHQMLSGTNLEEWETALGTNIQEPMDKDTVSPVWSSQQLAACFEFLMHQQGPVPVAFLPKQAHA